MKFDSSQAECSVPWLNEVLVLFTVALQLCQQLKDKVSQLIKFKFWFRCNRSSAKCFWIVVGLVSFLFFLWIVTNVFYSFIMRMRDFILSGASTPIVLAIKVKSEHFYILTDWLSHNWWYNNDVSVPLTVLLLTISKLVQFIPLSSNSNNCGIQYLCDILLHPVYIHWWM